MTEAPRIAIIGGGLAGLAAAAALASLGFTAEVFEEVQSLSEVGAGVNISQRGIPVLRAMGSLSEQRCKSLPPASICSTNSCAEKKLLAFCR
jgi:salicylate hydroxylase